MNVGEISIGGGFAAKKIFSSANASINEYFDIVAAEDAKQEI